MSVVIIDTGCANLASVGFAFERLGAKHTITNNLDVIQSADRVILPGVGSASYAMQALNQGGLATVIKSLTQPVLGICLGMQLLFSFSNEGDVAGLGLIDGRVGDLDEGVFPVPHMGWNTLENIADDPLLDGVKNGDYVYFVHSYAVPENVHTIASCTHNNPFTAIVRRDNIYGCQFHPERSGKTGARILENFLKVSA